MRPITQTVPVPQTSLWVGRVLSAVAVLFMLFDGIMKVMVLAPVVESSAHLGYPASLAVGTGILELACVVVYLIPRTAVLGVVLLTAYLGGATAIHVRIGDPFYFPILIGVLLWGGLLFTDERLRTVFPLRH